METIVKTTDSNWQGLYTVAGVAALIIAVFIPIQLFVFFKWPPPDTVIGWFTLFRNNWLIGLLDMDLLLIVDTILFIPIFLALYVVLRRTSESYMAIALAAGLIGIASYLASTAAFEMLSLSNQYAAATTEAQKSVLLAAGHVMAANWMGTAFDVGYVSKSIALLIISVVMLQSTIFNRVITCLGILTGALMLLPPTAGTIGLILSVSSVFPLEIWCILISLRFLHLAKNT